ncbi:hypothetical protein [Tardiphaga alba]|uniref:hypothetical protein n=1 Tax=Tardiphaga alba TaxID=340268 RepID=UPI001BADC077|nr:hypothetical protein [Tardiphaga alba]
MTDESIKNFNKRHSPQAAPEEPTSRKRSSQIALLLMGTMAVGGGAYALMPNENCDPNRVITPGQPRQECQQRSSSWSSSSGGHGYSSSGSSSSSSRANFTGSSTSSGTSVAGTSSSGTHVARSGFGSFGSHFSGGG